MQQLIHVNVSMVNLTTILMNPVKIVTILAIHATDLQKINVFLVILRKIDICPAQNVCVSLDI